MSGLVADSLRELLKVEKKKYLEESAEFSGTAQEFRDRISKKYSADPTKFVSLVFDLMEATTRTWQATPRKVRPDLFSIADVLVPNSLTRYASGQGCVPTRIGFPHRASIGPKAKAGHNFYRVSP